MADKGVLPDSHRYRARRNELENRSADVVRLVAVHLLNSAAKDQVQQFVGLHDRKVHLGKRPRDSQARSGFAIVESNRLVAR